MEVDLQKLKAAAEAATPGAWHVEQGHIAGANFIVAEDGYKLLETKAQHHPRLVLGGERRANANFVAAANPSVVLALIAEIERVTKACEAHGHALQLAAQAAGLLAGADTHRDLVPAIEQLNKRIQDLQDDAP